VVKLKQSLNREAGDENFRKITLFVPEQHISNLKEDIVMKKNRMTLMASTVLVGVVVIIYTGHIYSANAQGAINPQTGEFGRFY
jgi:hypothetical protein